jgi:hypothetical protein
MKILPEHYEYMKNKMSERSVELFGRYSLIHAEGKAQDIDKRVRWDLARDVGLVPFFCDTLYKYANDDHIDTALRKIIEEIQEPVLQYLRRPVPKLGKLPPLDLSNALENWKKLSRSI